MKKTVLITGGNTGIGRATAVALAKRGFRVVFTSRDPARGAEAEAAIRGESGSADVRCMALDLASFDSIDAFADAFLAQEPRLDVLVLNAGLVLGDRRLTAEGFEMTFGVNHLGHFRLAQKLLPRVVESAPARILVLASQAHKRAKRGLAWDDLRREKRYSSFDVYGESKLANIYFARELARRVDPSKVVVHAIHPGVVATEFALGGDAPGPVGWFFRFARPFLRTPEKGAATTVHLATSDDATRSTGEYWKNEKRARPTKIARDDDAARRLWDLSESWVARA